MSPDELTLPPALAEAHKDGFDYDHGEGIDFEPYQHFMTAQETTEWFRAWTGNPDADASAFRVFGQDGTGGLAAFWLVTRGEPIENQPIVFLGSEGETSVVACDLPAYLWLLAGGTGPAEAVANPGWQGRSNHRLTQLAIRHDPQGLRAGCQIVAEAKAAFPGFENLIENQCR